MSSPPENASGSCGSARCLTTHCASLSRRAEPVCPASQAMAMAVVTWYRPDAAARADASALPLASATCAARARARLRSWSNTSLALDVIRAARREAALPALAGHLQRLLAATPLHPGAREVFNQVRNRALALAAQVADAKGNADASARAAASGLYHVTTAVAMAWEAGQTG